MALRRLLVNDNKSLPVVATRIAPIKPQPKIEEALASDEHGPHPAEVPT